MAFPWVSVEFNPKRCQLQRHTATSTAPRLGLLQMPACMLPKTWAFHGTYTSFFCKRSTSCPKERRVFGVGRHTQLIPSPDWGLAPAHESSSSGWEFPGRRSVAKGSFFSLWMVIKSSSHHEMKPCCCYIKKNKRFLGIYRGILRNPVVFEVPRDGDLVLGAGPRNWSRAFNSKGL